MKKKPKNVPSELVFVHKSRKVCKETENHKPITGFLLCCKRAIFPIETLGGFPVEEKSTRKVASKHMICGKRMYFKRKPLIIN